MQPALQTPCILKLPWQFHSGTVSSVAEETARLAANGWPQQLTIDFSNLGFVRPAGVVFLSNLISWLQNQGTTVLFDNHYLPTEALKFLDDALFFEYHCGVKLRPLATPRSTTRPLQKIAHANSHAWLRDDLTPWLSGRLGITQASLYSFQNCLAELFNNIQDHTRHDIGTIFAQHFPRENKVYVTLSDFGFGIPANVRTVEPFLTDYQAIVRATEEGFTTRPTPRNRGIGLDYLLTVVVRENGGAVTFCSGYSMVRFERGADNNLSHQEIWSTGFCPGTTVDIILRTDTIIRIPDATETLEW